MALALAAWAGNGTWNWFTEGYTNGLSVEAIANWNDPANWVDGEVPSGDAPTAWLVPSGQSTSMSAHPTRWIAVPPEGVTLGYLSSRQAAKIYITGGPISFAGTSTYNAYYGALRDETANSPNCPVWIFNPVSFTDKGLNAIGLYCNRARLCGPIDASGNIAVADAFRHHLNRFAVSDSEAPAEVSVTGRYTPGSGSIRIYARMSAPEQTGWWRTTEGSPYLHRTGVAHELSPGCRVTGAGIPEGAWLKRVFKSDIVEISAPATASSADEGGTELTFGAFNPVTDLHVMEMGLQGTSGISFMFTKFRPDDNARFTVKRLIGTNLSWYVIDMDDEDAAVVSTNAVCRPGTFVIENADSYKYHPLYLQRAHIELACATFPILAVDNVSGWDARVTVTNGQTATVKSMHHWKGSLVKDGAGTLVVQSTNATHKALTVEAGTFRFAPSHPGPATLATLSVASGATFELEAGCALRVTSEPTFASGSTIVLGEDAYLILPNSYTLPDGVTISGTGFVLKDMATGGLAEDPIRGVQPAGAIIGTPAFWITAESLTNAVPSGELVEEDGMQYVRRWNDCRSAADGGRHFCTNTYLMPQLVTSGAVPYVHIPAGVPRGAENASKNRGLAWDEPITNIRAVFAVLIDQTCMGSLLGATRRLKTTDYVRGSTSWSSYIFYSAASANVRNGAIYVNCVEKAYSNTLANNSSSTFIVEVETQGNTSADAFGMCDSTNYQNRWDLCGGRVVEYIIYTNALSYAERLQVSDWLMRKWCGRSAAHSYADRRQRIDSLGFQSNGHGGVNVASGEAATVLSVDSGGTLLKTGAGTLHLMDYTDATGALRIREGTLTLQSVDPQLLTLPGGAYLHLDASDETSFTTTTYADSSTRVTEWRDPVSGRSATPFKTASTNLPRRVADVLNGRAVVDFGYALGSGVAAEADAAKNEKNNPSLKFTGSLNLHTVFSVIGSAGGGNTLLGGSAGRNDGLQLRSPSATLGIWRDVQYHPRDPSLPLVTTTGNTSIQMGNISDPAKTEFRKDGVTVNQKTEPMGGGYNLYSVRTLTSHKLESNILGGIHYAQSWGGIEIGELAYYERVLSQDEVADVESRLRWKWFNAGVPYRRPAVAGTVTVDAGATLSVVGGAPLTVTELSGTGMIVGGVALGANAVIHAYVNGEGAVDGPLTVDGSVNISNGGTVTLSGDVSRLVIGEYPLISSEGTLVGSADGWVIAPVNTHKVLSLCVRDDALVLCVKPKGVIISFR